MESQKKKINTNRIKTYIPLMFALAFFIFTKVAIQPVIVFGNSMSPNFHNKQIVFADRRYKELNRFDVVVVKAGGKNIIKRIVGLPGEKVEVTTSGVKINDEYIEDVIDVEIESPGTHNCVILGENEYYVLGDNRNNSSDSRVYGAFALDDIIGRIYVNK